ncbi:hypothetical protein YC2023_095216 [Brassica napus]
MGGNGMEERALKIVGKTPLEAATTIVEDYELPCGVDEFNLDVCHLLLFLWFLKFLVLCVCRMDKTKALLGANRLIRLLKGRGMPMALAFNSSRANIESKISYREVFKRGQANKYDVKSKSHENLVDSDNHSVKYVEKVNNLSKKKILLTHKSEKTRGISMKRSDLVQSLSSCSKNIRSLILEFIGSQN